MCWVPKQSDNSLLWDLRFFSIFLHEIYSTAGFNVSTVGIQLWASQNQTTLGTVWIQLANIYQVYELARAYPNKPTLKGPLTTRKKKTSKVEGLKLVTSAKNLPHPNKACLFVAESEPRWLCLRLVWPHVPPMHFNPQATVFCFRKNGFKYCLGINWCYDLYTQWYDGNNSPELDSNHNISMELICEVSFY